MNLPWPIKKLEEVCEPIKIEKAPVGIMPYIEIGDIDVETKKINFKEKGAVKGSIFAPDRCVIVSRVRPTRGAVALLDKKVAVSSAFTILKPKSILDLKFLFYYLAYNPNFFEYLGQRQKGSNYPSCREKDILNFEIPLPPLEIQKRIVSRIEELFEKIDKAKELRAKALEETEEIFQSALQEIFDKAEKKWGIKKLREVLELFDNGIWGPEDKINGIRILRSTNFKNDGTINFREVALRKVTNISLKEKRLRRGDILLERSGGGPTQPVGRVVYFDAGGEYYFGNFITRLRPKTNVYSRFLFYVLFNFHQRGITETLQKQTTNIRNLKFNEYLNLEIPLPPLSEQKKIVAYLDDLREKIEKLKQLQQEQLEELNELKKSILEKAFKGELNYPFNSLF
jgi:type I restriction enzyme S subunit